MSSSAIDSSDDGRSEFLTFFVDGEEYAIGLTRVREVIPYDTITRVPQMPRAVRGITNVRGQVVPVLDLMRKFHDDDTPITSRTCIVLVEAIHDGVAAVIGLMTESVGQVLALTAAEIAPPPNFGAPIRTELLAGMGRVGKKFALLLEIDRLLDPTEMLATSAASTPDDAVMTIEAGDPATSEPAL